MIYWKTTAEDLCYDLNACNFDANQNEDCVYPHHCFLDRDGDGFGAGSVADMEGVELHCDCPDGWVDNNLDHCDNPEADNWWPNHPYTN